MNENVDNLGKKRTFRLKTNVIVAFLGKIFATIISLVRVPILINYLEPNGYGLFITITSVANWIQIGQIGMASGLVNALVECDSKNDKENAQRYVNSLWIGLALVLLILTLVVFASFPFISWNKIFPSDDSQLAAQVPRTIAFTLMTVLFGMLMTPLNSIYNAYQEQYKLSLWSNFQGTIALASIVVAVQLKLGMAGIALAIGISTLFVSVINYFWLTWLEKPYLKFNSASLSFVAFKRVWSSSVSFFVIEISALLVFQTDRFLILQFSNPTEVTKYTLASTLYLTFSGIYFLLLKPLWPAFGEAIHRGDVNWVKRVFYRINFLSTVGMALLVIIMLVVGKKLILLWTGRSDVEADNLLFAILGFYFLIRIWTDTHSILMFSLDKQGEMLWATVSHGFLNLILGIILGKFYGVYGIALASLISFALSSGWWIPYRTRFYLRNMTS